jgi:hypothetical protein
MSPEVCKNNIMPNAYGTGADIWALGISRKLAMFWML